MSTQLAPPPVPAPPPPQPPSVSAALRRAFVIVLVLAAVTAVAALALGAWHMSQTTVERDRNVYPAVDELTVDLHANGNLTVSVHDRDEIIVESRQVTSFRGAQASETVDSDALRLASERCDPVLFGWLHRCNASYDVTVPADTGVVADLRHGSAELAGITADVELSTRHGGMTVSDTAGDVQVSSAHGHIEVSDAEGTLAADARHGRIALTGVEGDAEVVSRHGNISVLGGAGALRAETHHGGVSVAETTGEVAWLRSSHGAIDYHPAAPPHDVGIETSHGNVQVSVPPNAPAYAIQAQASSGTPTIDVPSDANSDYQMMVTTRHGSIDITAAAAFGSDP